MLLQGGLEFLSRSTTLSAPAYTARPASLPSHLPPVTLMAVDILPTALPLEASQHFSSAFLPYLRALVRGYDGRPAKDEDAAVAEALDRATVAEGGELSTSFEWLRGPLSVWKSAAASEGERATSSPTPAPAPSASTGVEGIRPKKNVLMLGSGMVAPPAVEELCSRADVRLVVGKYIHKHRHSGAD